MWFGYNSRLFFVTFLQVELSHFSGIIYNNVNGQGILWKQLLLQFYTDSFETSLVFGHGLKICMWFGYMPQIIFAAFLQVKLGHFAGIFSN